MTNNIIARGLAGVAVLGLALTIVLTVPQSAHAWGGYGYGNGYGNSYYNSYNNNHGYNPYPPAPSYYTIPSVQVTYANGYYQNYFVPTVRYFPAPAPLPVYTTYYPSQPPAYTYPGNNNFPGYGGYNRHW